jgi:hypothetical protein
LIDHGSAVDSQGRIIIAPYSIIYSLPIAGFDLFFAGRGKIVVTCNKDVLTSIVLHDGDYRSNFTCPIRHINIDRSDVKHIYRPEQTIPFQQDGHVESGLYILDHSGIH